MEQAEIYITKEVIEKIKKSAIDNANRETGGIIAGTGKLFETKVIITHCSLAGPKAIKKKYFFSRDTNYCQNILNKWVIESNGKIDYLGEWHKHLEKNAKPSSIDIETMKKINNDKSYHIDNAIMLIIGLDNIINLFIIRNNKAVQLNWKLYEN